MKIVDQLKEFIVSQDVIPKSIKIHPEAILQLEAERFVYIIDKSSKNPVKRFMGIELIPSTDVKSFAIVEKDDKDERWIVKREVKKLKEKYILGNDELSKDMSLLFAYLGYLERELEDKTNFLHYIREKEAGKISDEQK